MKTPLRTILLISRRTRWAGLVLLVTILTTLAVQSRLAPVTQPGQSLPADDRHRYNNRYFRVVKVVDGDTLDIGVRDLLKNKPWTRIRLWGVDTPETKDPRKAVMYFGPEASAFAKKQALHKLVRVVLEPYERTRGKYGRLLAYIYLPNGKMLNEELLRQGYAYADTRFRHMWRDKFVGLEKQAHSEKRGLWKAVRPEQWPQWYRKRHRHPH